MRKVRCAIYTRKSSEEGLEQEFNSLDAQREACSAYIASQKHEGWVELKERYDDGGISGGTMARPGLQHLMQDLDDGLIDQIVVYKIDRLTRSLADFAKLVERLDAKEASFVSVTQSFNTATSMGRLTLNVLLSFAQFEREVTAERIRDKITASKKKGLWMGGSVPLGYSKDGRTLKVHEEEAEIVRKLYSLYEELCTITNVYEKALELRLGSRRPSRSNVNGDGGYPYPEFERSHIHYILTNPTYAGRIRHKNKTYDGQHSAIIPSEKWEQIQKFLASESQRKRGSGNKGRSPTLLAGKMFDKNGVALAPTYTMKRGRCYSYYVSGSKAVSELDEAGNKRLEWRMPAKQVETQIADAVVKHLISRQANLLLAANTKTEDYQRLNSELDNLTRGKGKVLEAIKRANLSSGKISVQLSCSKLAELLKLDAALINQTELAFPLPFTQRKRGVETKLLLSNTGETVDPVLQRNLATAHRYLAYIQQGQSLDDIALSHNTKKQRVRELIKIALLAPDLTEDLISGEAPLHITSDTLVKTAWPVDWNEQRQQMANLAR